MIKNLTPLLTMVMIGITAMMITLNKISPCATLNSYGVCGNYATHAILFMGAGLLITLTGLLSTIGIIIRYYRFKDELITNHFTASIRQGLLLSSAITLIATLYITQNFHWLIGVAVIFIVIVLEYIFSWQEK